MTGLLSNTSLFSEGDKSIESYNPFLTGVFYLGNVVKENIPRAAPNFLLSMHVGSQHHWLPLSVGLENLWSKTIQGDVP
jgi:hypothetical protein